eukprot:768808-Hanusia_phi.AAC.4
MRILWDGAQDGRGTGTAERCRRSCVRIRNLLICEVALRNAPLKLRGGQSDSESESDYNMDVPDKPIELIGDDIPFLFNVTKVGVMEEIRKSLDPAVYPPEPDVPEEAKGQEQSQQEMRVWEQGELSSVVLMKLQASCGFEIDLMVASDSLSGQCCDHEGREQQGRQDTSLHDMRSFHPAALSYRSKKNGRRCSPLGMSTASPVMDEL